MSNVLSNEQRQQILALGRLGWTLRRIEQATGSRRETVSAYLKAAGLAVRGPGRPATQAAKPAISGEVSPDSAAAHPATTGAVSTDAVPPGRAPPASACEPFRERIEAALTQGRNAVAIYQDLVSDHGFPASYASVRRFVRRLRGRRSVEARVVITTAPGEEGQVDYGSGPMVRDPHSGRYRRTRLFAFTLGYSRKSVRLLVWRSTTQIWAELHERAFRRLGGTVRVVVHDNLREGVLTPDIYDPTLRKPNIKAKLAESEAEALAKADLSAQHVLEVIRRHVMRDLSAYVQADGHLKPLHELTPDQIRLLDGVVRKPDGSTTYRLDPPHKWTEMAAKHFSLLTERVELVDHRHIEDKLIEARERAVKAGHAKKHPDVGKAT